jgi:hypothetical protein
MSDTNEVLPEPVQAGQSLSPGCLQIDVLEHPVGVATLRLPAS